MKMEFRYRGRSAVASGLETAALGLATTALREPTYFRGTLGRPLVVREGLAALHDVVISDLKWRARDRVAFAAWLAEQDRQFVLSLAAKSSAARAQIEEKQARLVELLDARRGARAPFEAARQKYFAFALADELELETVLDPVVTVHPDELALEAFSKDQSSYARLSISYDVFSAIDAYECGTTNVDFSATLADHFNRIRSYRGTTLVVAPSGLVASTSGEGGASERVVREKRIELPAGWLEGFLRVHGLMSMGLTRVRLAPIDVLNVLRALRLHRAKASPRAIRWELTPGAPVKIVLEPWSRIIECSPASVFEGSKPLSIRTWGRDRLRVLERVLPVAERFDVMLAGTGLPSVWVADLGTEVTFTLALSGWTDNDWVEGPARFDLLTRREAVSADELTRVYEALRAARKGTDAGLAAQTQLPIEKTRSALSILCQAGRAMIDVARHVHRHRDLLLEPWSASAALAAARKEELETAPGAKQARTLHVEGEIRIIARRPFSGGYKVSGNARAGETRVRPQISIDHEGQILSASCTCEKGKKHGMTHGPCEHVLALRLAHMERTEKEKESLH